MIILMTDHDRTGSDGLTRAEVWKLLDTYQQQWKERFDRHAIALDRNTTAMTDGFNSISDRLLVVETERDVEKRTASQHGAIAGSVSAGLVVGLVEAIKRAFHS
jgi:hypothetical protein